MIIREHSLVFHRVHIEVINTSLTSKVTNTAPKGVEH